MAGETLSDGQQQPEKVEPRENSPDFQTASFPLPKEELSELFDREPFYERKEEEIGNSNFKSNLNSNSTSQQFSSLKWKSKASIIGFPNPQKSSFMDYKFRRSCRPENTLFFPKQSGGKGKFGLLVSEPLSPKVSCVGTVRSKKDKSRRSSNGTTSKTTGIWASFKAIFRFSSHENRGVGVKVQSRESPPCSFMAKESYILNSEALSEPPGLGGLNRFESGRRSMSWGGCDAIWRSDPNDL